MTTVTAIGVLHGGVLTYRQREVFVTIFHLTKRNGGIPPSIKEMMVALDIASANGIKAHLNALERKGFIRQVPVNNRNGAKARSLRIVGLTWVPEFDGSEAGWRARRILNGGATS